LPDGTFFPNILERSMVSIVVEAKTDNAQMPPKSARVHTKLGAFIRVIKDSASSDTKYEIDDKDALARTNVLLLKGRLPT
jgi:hypothetical protein